jgi:hypothetical protein
VSVFKGQRRSKGQNDCFALLSPFAASIGDPESRNPFMFAV